MKKILLIISSLFFASVCWATPTNSISIPNTFSANTVIYSSAVNADFNEGQTKFNAHSHTDLTLLGVITTGTWNATLIGTTYGGTGLTSYAQGDIVYSSATDALSKLTKDTNSTRYLSNQGTSNNPSWNQVDLTNGITGILPIANGGTSRSVATSAILQLLPGLSASKFLTNDGNAISWASAQHQTLYTSSDTFTAPTGITTVYLTMVGGGGGGGGGSSAGSQTSGGGGGSGAYCYRIPYGVTPGNNYTVTINTGGGGGAAETNGTAGGSVVFDTITVNGGSGGTSGATGGAGGVAGVGVVGTGGAGQSGSNSTAGSYIISSGATGGAGAGSTDLYSGGAGAGSIAGLGGIGRTNLAGLNGSGYGSGGGGGASKDTGRQAGNGTNGAILVEY